MTRQEIIEKLNNSAVNTHLTILPSEGAIECRYMTAKGSKTEWISISDWPASRIEKTDGIVYVLKLNGKKYQYKEYKDFENSFLKNCIGEVEPWENCTDEELEEWLELMAGCDGISFLE